jgi:hypothetical protein
MNIIETLKPMLKAVVPTAIGAITTAILVLLEQVGIGGDVSVQEAVSIMLVSIATSLGVYQVPNKPKGV